MDNELRKNSQKIADEHLKRVIIYNGCNGVAIDAIKEVSKEQRNKQKDFYDKWENFFFFSNGSYTENIWSRKSFIYGQIVFFFIVTAVLYKLFHSEYILGGGIGAITYSFYLLGEKGGHKKGYIDGYEFGLRDGVNRVLGIDEEDEKLIEKERESGGL